MNKPSKWIVLLLALFPFTFLTAQIISVDAEEHIQMHVGAQDGYILQSDANGVGYWQAPLNVERKQICVTDFGAVGDSATDDAAAFQAAIDSAAVLGVKVCVPAGQYKIGQTLLIPSGVILEGDGLGQDFLTSGVSGSVLRYHGTGYAIEVRGFFSGLRDIVILDRTNLEATRAEGGVKLIADQGGPYTGNNHFFNILISHFDAGTALKLEADNNSGIAYASFYDINIRHGKKAIHIEEKDATSYVNSNTFFQGVFSGGGYDYGVHAEAGNNNTFFGTIFEAANTNFGHIVVENEASINCYDIRLEASSQSPSIPLIDLKSTTHSNYIKGLYSGGVIVDKGTNYVQMYSSKAIGVRQSGYNQYQNAAFWGVENNAIPYWNLTGTGIRVEVQAPEYKSDHHVLLLRIPPGVKGELFPITETLPEVLSHQRCLFGAYIKTDRTNFAFTSISNYQHTTGTCAIAASSFHLGDNDWNFTGMEGKLNAICPVNPKFIFDNTAYGDSASVYITTPSFSYGHKNPSLEAAPVLTSGGVMTGTLSTNMISVDAPSVGNTLIVPKAGNVFEITGTTTISRINDTVATRFPKGTIITLLFNDAGLSVINGAFIQLVSNYTSVVNSSLTLVAMGNGTWRELNRNL